MEMQSISAMAARERSATRSRLAWSVVRAVWLGLAPAVLAVLCQHYLLPSPMEAKGGLSAFLLRVGTEQPVAVLVALFLVFAALFRYWQFYLPGMRPLTASSWGVPASVSASRLHAYERCAELLSLLTPARLGKISPTRSVTLQAHAADLQNALGADDLARAVQSEKALRALLAEYRFAPSEASKSFVTLLAAALVTLFVRNSVVQPFRVLTESMLPTLEPGDWIAANRLAYGFHVPLTHLQLGSRPPKRGDVIAFETPPGALRGQPEQLVKRVIGLPGDRILMRHGRPNINGWPVPSCEAGVFAYLAADTAVRGRLMVEFLGDKSYLTVYFQGSEAFNGYVVKPGEVFVLGDNRDNSSDSRAWNNNAGGGLAFQAIDGRVDTILLGTGRDGSADWKRLLKPLGLGLRFDGMDLSQVQAGIEHCLRDAPHESVPAP
jgi:signal peptidase I